MKNRPDHIRQNTWGFEEEMDGGAERMMAPVIWKVQRRGIDGRRDQHIA